MLIWVTCVIWGGGGNFYAVSYRHKIAFFVAIGIFFFIIFLPQTMFAQRDAYIIDGKVNPEFLKYFGVQSVTPEQDKALRESGNRYDSELDAIKESMPDVDITELGASIETLKKRFEPVTDKYYAEVRAILAWPNGKAPNNNTQPQQPAKTPAEKAADDAASKIENAKEAYPGNPYDDEKRFTQLNLTQIQITKITNIRITRQKAMAAAVKTASHKKNTMRTRRALYSVLRFIAALANYRIRYSLTPRQIGTFDQPDVFPVDMDPPGFENLTQGTPPQQIFGGTEDEVNRDAEKRLTRTNFFKYQEFQSMLNLDDEQMNELAGYDAESRAAFQAATEILAESDANEFVIDDCDKQFARIQEQIRRLIPRGQRESFNTLMLLLFDAMEFPAQNLASFANMEGWTEADAKKVRDVLTPFVNTNRKLVLDPSDVSVSRQRTLQTELESKVQAVLPSSIRTAWQDAKSSHKDVYDAVMRYKEQ